YEVPALPSTTVTSLTRNSGGAAWAGRPAPSVNAAIVLVATATRSRMERARMTRSPVVCAPEMGDGVTPYIGRSQRGPYACARGESRTQPQVGVGSGWVRVQRALGDQGEELLDRQVTLLDVGRRRGRHTD